MAEIMVKFYFCKECKIRFKNLRHFVLNPSHDYKLVKKTYTEKKLDDF